MTVYQQDKHTGKVESSFLSSWIGNPRKQVQKAGGNADPCLAFLSAGAVSCKASTDSSGPGGNQEWLRSEIEGMSCLGVQSKL
ncbi:hypothetical protein LEMLEM_LOCUS1584 [Lemmus lemmus]